MSTYLDYDHEADETKRALGITVRSFAARTYRSLTSSQGVKVGDKTATTTRIPNSGKSAKSTPSTFSRGPFPSFQRSTALITSKDSTRCAGFASSLRVPLLKVIYMSVRSTRRSTRAV